MNSGLKTRIENLLSTYYGSSIVIRSAHPCSGGSIHNCMRVELENGLNLFLKTGQSSLPGVYQCEYKALECFHEIGQLAVPEPILAEDDFLLMQWLELGPAGPQWQEQTGRALALMHRAGIGSRFGFHEDNYLGTSPQPNQWQDSWLTFWREQRLGHQLAMWTEKCSADDPLPGLGYTLCEQLDKLLGGLCEPAVLLHGDLWSGNAAADRDGAPVIFDPACYYGHREAEFGMMRLFGGFGQRCESAYREIWPFEPGFEDRVKLYRLYHELNHLNIFGTAYHKQCLETAKSLL